MNRRDFIKASLSIPFLVTSNSFANITKDNKSEVKGLVESKEKWIMGNDELNDLEKNQSLDSTAWDKVKASYYTVKRRYKAAKKAWLDN